MKTLNLWKKGLIGAAFLALLLPSSGVANPDEFSLKSYDGESTYALSESDADFVALHFLLKTDCPICLRYTRTYHEGADAVPGVDHLYIKPDAPNDIASWAAKLRLPDGPTVYRDPEASLAKAYSIPDGYQFHGETVHYPAFILLNSEGEEVFRYVGEDNSDRYSFSDFAKKVRELTVTESKGLLSTDSNGVAIKGYDPVSYRRDEKATKGKPELVALHEGALYHFSSAENRDLFTKNPEKYLPEYGGWCATGVSIGEKLDIDPTNFAIKDGKLYLFLKNESADGKKMWLETPEQNKEKADQTWLEWKEGTG